MYQIVPTQVEHIHELAGTMRQADRDEVWAVNHSSPLKALEDSVTYTRESFTGLVDGKVVCIFGTSSPSLISDEGVPWLLGSDLVKENSHVFLRMSRVYAKEIKKRYPYLRNYVDARNKAAIEWLKWLGFTLSDPVPYGIEGLPFHKFEYRRD